jgi:hypothetical protein
MDKSTLILIINGLVGMVLALFAFIGKQALDEIKQLRERVHRALNGIVAIEAVLKLRQTERMGEYDGKDTRRKRS